MVMKCSAACLVALALLGVLCDAQWTGHKPSKPQRPVQEPVKQKIQDPQQQRKQTFEKALTWTYPADPEPEQAVVVPFELRHPVPAATVSVECREAIAHVEVMKDMFGVGQLVSADDLLLGNCAAVAEDAAAGVLIFQSELHNCLSVLTMTEDSLIYTFTVNYSPRPQGTSPVVRTSSAAVIAECHYPRKHNVSSLPLDPLWIPYSAVKVADELLYFTLKLMTDDWQYERPSYQYFLGDIINIEAIVKQFFHVPLRVYVDSCVATLAPDAASNPRYAFIDNHGCMLDGRLTGSNSKFMARTAENKLQFQLEAFRFQGADSGLLFITCHLKATSTAYAIDAAHRACSYTSGWREASGADAACGTCESADFGPPPVPGSSSVPLGPLPVHSSGKIGAGATTGGWGASGTSLSTPGRKMRDVSESEIFEWEGEVTLGPISIGEKVKA